MIRLEAFMLTLSCLILGISTASGQVKPAETLDGDWVPSSAELGGQQFPDEVRKAIKLTIKADQYTVTIGKSIDSGTLTLDAASDPKAITISGVEGPNKGRKIPAIFELKGDTLTICYDLSGKARPTEFKTAVGTQLFLVTYRRRP